MNNKKLENWCRKATALIRYGPDRKAVEAELMAHMEDCRLALMERGMDEADATRQALAAMGSAEDLAPELAAVHRPFWGYAHSITKAIAIILCGIALFMVLATHISIANAVHTYAGTPSTLHPGDAQPWQVLTHVHPENGTYTDGYYLRIPAAILWQHPDGELLLTFHLQSVHSPFLENLNCSSHFWAVDSLGNRYLSYNETESTDQPHVGIGGLHSTRGYQCNDMKVYGISSSNIQWLELHYDRDGRDIVLHIDLTGGDGV